ncbi:MAG: ribonuclease Z [Clostridia bacterium]|nr:ribonuclease Z [Clostridia bacterium]
MKITFIGTSHGIPERDRKCSSAIIRIGDRSYFVDMGTQSIEWLRVNDVPVESVKAVFVTHMHGDHVNGLPSFLDLCNWFFTGAEPKIFMPSKEGADALVGWVIALEKRAYRGIEVNTVTEGVIFDDGFLKVTAYRTQHCRNSFAYLLESDGKRVLFTGDLQSPAVDFPLKALEKRLDVLICESAHFDPNCYTELFKDHDVGSVYFNHIQPRRIPILEELTESLRETVPAQIAYDGLEIHL